MQKPISQNHKYRQSIGENIDCSFYAIHYGPVFDLRPCEVATEKERRILGKSRDFFSSKAHSSAAIQDTELFKTLSNYY